MVRQGSVVILHLAVGLVLAASGAAPAEPAPSQTTSFDRKPYKIQVHLGIEPETRIDSRMRQSLLDDWMTLVRRFVGAPWDLNIAKGDDSTALAPLDLLTKEAFAKLEGGPDKVWILQVRRNRATLELLGREFDATVKRLGPIRRAPVPVVADLPRSLLNLALDLFAPLAEVGESIGGDVSVTIQGASLEPASPIGRVAVPGTVFEPLRITVLKDGKSTALGIPFSYLRVVSINGSTARCAIVSALRDPLTKRIARKTSLVALGIKPGIQPTRLRFVTRADKAPAAGYLLTARTIPDGPPREIGTTDREGRITLESGFADGLVALRLLAGNIEPMVELPLMPGLGGEERTIPFEPKPETVALEAQLDAIRDSILDLVAIRARLEARLKARSDGDDWDGVAETLKEFATLTPRTKYADRIAQLKEDAARQQAKNKTAILTKTAQAQIAEVQALIDRYLDDDLIRGYTDAVQRARDEAARAKAKPAKKATPKASPAPVPAPAAKEAAAKPTPKAPADDPRPPSPAVPF